MNTSAIIESLGITREDIINAAAKQLAESAYGEGKIVDDANRIINTNIKRLVDESAKAKIDEVLTNELMGLLKQEYTPTNMWGEPTGEPTTIRDALAEHARTFWTQKVDNKGQARTGYGTKPRHEWLFGEIVKDEFAKAINQEATNIVGALKDSLRDDLKSKLDDHLNKIIQVKSAGDQKKS